MRYQGKITNWKDDHGFGFITPNGGGPEVFVHIKSFSSRGRRPKGDEIVTYELTTNRKGQPRAENVAFVGELAPSRSRPATGTVLLSLAAIFLLFVAISVLVGRLPPPVLGLYLGASVIAFIAYAIDKSAARNERRRTPEQRLHMFSVIGGWPGALLAQRLLRHKSSKMSFQVTFWVTVLLNCSALAWLFTPTGSNALHAVLGML